MPTCLFASRAYWRVYVLLRHTLALEAVALRQPAAACKRYARQQRVRCSVEYGQKIREATQASGCSRQTEGETVGT